MGTTKQSQEAIKEASIRSGSPYVNERWLGGTLTNFTTIQKSIERLKELERMKEEKILDVLSKKENSRLAKTKFRLEKSLSGIKDMGELPSILFVIDPMSEITAIMEARKLEIPIVAVCDTNCNPDLIDYPIPGNDDAVRSIKLFCNYAADAILEGRQIAQKIEADENGGQPEKYPEIPASEGLEKLEENPQSPQVNVPENSSAVETKGAL